MPALYRSYLSLPLLLGAAAACSSEAPTTTEDLTAIERAALDPDGGPCGTAPDPIPTTSLEQVRTLLGQVWRACGPGLLQLPPINGDAGLELNPDGRWYVMAPAADGTLVRTPTGGTWQVDTNFDGSFAISLSTLDVLGSFGAVLAFRQAPLTVDMIANGEVVATYTAERPAVAPPPRQDAPTCGYWGFVTPPPSPEDPRALHGRWRKCGAGTVFMGSNSDDDGIEFASDGTFHQLAVNPDGSLARRGLNGTYAVFENVANGFQIDMQAPWPASEAGQVPFGGIAWLAEDPHQLRIRTATGVNYVRDGEPPPRRVREQQVTLEAPPGACDVTDQPLLPMSRGKDFVRALTGRWARCGGTKIFTNGDYVGIEFLKDGRFFALFPGPTPGTVIRGHGFDRAGAWDASGNETANPPQNPFGFSVMMDGEGSYAFATQLTSGVPQLQFYVFFPQFELATFVKAD